MWDRYKRRVCIYYIGERKLRKDNANKDFHYLSLHLDLFK